MRKIALLATLIAAFATPIAAHAEDIVIGAGLVMSGPFASYGTDARAGVDLGIQQINAQGGVLGRKLRADYADSSGDRAKAVAIYQKYAATPEVAAALLISSAEFVAVNPVSKNVGLPFISIGSVIPFKDFSPCAFRVNLILSNAMGAVLNSLKGKGVHRVAIIYDQVNNQTVAEADIVKTSLKKYGMELAGSESYSTGEQNFTLQLARIQEAKPDLLWVSSTTDEAALIINQARSMGMKAGIIGGAGMNDPRIGSLAGSAANGVMTFALFNVDDKRPAVVQFVKAFQSKNGNKTPPAYSALGYDSVMLIANAIRKAGSTDRTAVCKALASTTDFEGVDGAFSYTGPGDNQKQMPQILVFGDHGFSPLK
ncbi:ABC transporter substrate-binding protein [Paraburkholderia xenovorans]|uniref:ABC transporter substrate-binding protein n=1 Tax=Paraburkholderia xenovorans TaxID=36873 RepID=UPI001559904B|nr:ABC transporter substrate-binding protein [Paraburkholderia xenovorans]NPT38501.1 ABC transporter substrate-binding protein [Paraburkholderia xenovorans]